MMGPASTVQRVLESETKLGLVAHSDDRPSHPLVQPGSQLEVALARFCAEASGPGEPAAVMARFGSAF